MAKSTWRFLGWGWWLVHIVGIAAFYTLGNLFSNLGG